MTEHTAENRLPASDRMTPAEERELRGAFERDKWAGEWNSLPTAIDRVLRQRAEARDIPPADGRTPDARPPLPVTCTNKAAFGEPHYGTHPLVPDVCVHPLVQTRILPPGGGRA